MSVWIWRPGRLDRDPADEQLCRAAVTDRSGRFMRSVQCSRKPVCTRVVDGAKYGFCRQHDPESVKAKADAKREAERAEQAARQAAWERAQKERDALAACKAAIENIAAGHSDPQALAAEALAKFPE